MLFGLLSSLYNPTPAPTLPVPPKEDLIAKYAHRIPRPRFKCPFGDCTEAYSSECRLKSHIELAHPEPADPFPHVCDFPGCASKFERHSQLSKHRRTHREPVDWSKVTVAKAECGAIDDIDSLFPPELEAALDHNQRATLRRYRRYAPYTARRQASPMERLPPLQAPSWLAGSNFEDHPLATYIVPSRPAQVASENPQPVVQSESNTPLEQLPSTERSSSPSLSFEESSSHSTVGEEDTIDTHMEDFGFTYPDFAIPTLFPYSTRAPGEDSEDEDIGQTNAPVDRRDKIRGWVENLEQHRDNAFVEVGADEVSTSWSVTLEDLLNDE